MKMLEEKYENLKLQDLKDEEIKIKLSKKAFKGPLHCPKCNIEMKKIHTDLDLMDDKITIHLEAYKCEKCGRERLSGKQALKLDQITIMIDAMKEKIRFKFERAANFDGRNWFIRFPVEITRDWNKQMVANITPLSQKDFLIHFKKQ